MQICPSCSHDNALYAKACVVCGFLLNGSLEETDLMPVAAPAIAIEGRFPPGAVIAGRYRIVAPLGSGGMGEVYRATDLKLQQTVALKFLPQALSNDAHALNHLYNEVRLARQISHPNVCRVYDIAEDNGLPFLTMEYVDGEDLRSLLRRIGRVPGEKASEIARRLCAGLGAAHDRGVLHRDLKPANIMLDAQGNVRLTDFGLAALVPTLEPHDHGCGTPAYMAPEQLAGQQASVRTDIYSLGLVLFEVFGGVHPFRNCSTPELLRRKREATAADFALASDVDPQVTKAIAHCLQTDPRDRPQSAAEVAAELSGGDPLAAALAAGETPAPELVARAGPTEGLSVRAAVSSLAAVIAALIIITLLAPRVTLLRRVHIERSDALERIARDKLMSVGLDDGAKHRVTRFTYDLDSLRHRFDPAALYFWYRASPDWIVPLRANAAVTVDDPPGDFPGMITTKWDGAGRLLYLRAVPRAGGASSLTASELWARLFSAAGLEAGHFQPAEAGWIAAPGWDGRASWTGAYPDSNRTPIRVEAAAWRGRPVYFEVIPAWRQATGLDAPLPLDRTASGQWLLFIIQFAVSAVLAWRNVRLGRGDRQGAFRIALFVLAVSCAMWACKASHVPTLAEFKLLFAVLSWAVLVSVFTWMIYMALEPYVRRRWPHAIISWTRVLSGRLRDPVVGRDILIGTAFGALTVVAMNAGAALAHASGLRLPSSWMLSGFAGTLAYTFDNMAGAVLRGVGMLFLTFLFKLFFRKEWLAALVIVAMAFVYEAPGSPLSAAAVGLIFVPVAFAYVYLLLRGGLWPVIVAIYTAITLMSLPLSTDLSAPGAGASILVLCSVAALALFGFHSTLAGRALFKLDM